MKTNEKYILFISMPAIENYPLMFPELEVIKDKLESISTHLIREIYQNHLREIPEGRIEQLIEIYIDDQTLVNVLSEYGDQAEGWIKTTLEEYFFHFRNETLDFELLHMAEKLAFMETSMRQKFHFLTPLDEIKPNEDNLTVGI